MTEKKPLEKPSGKTNRIKINDVLASHIEDYRFLKLQEESTENSLNDVESLKEEIRCLVEQARAEERAEWKQRIDDLEKKFICKDCLELQTECPECGSLQRFVKSIKGEGDKEV